MKRSGPVTRLVFALKMRHRATDPRRSRTMRLRLFAMGTIIAAVLLPVARPVGYALSDFACTGADCSSVIGDVPTCGSFNRDRAYAAGTRTFSRPGQGDDESGALVIGYGDGTVDVVDTRHRERPRSESGGHQREVYRFDSVTTAKRWILDHFDSASGMINASSGPVDGGEYRGLLRVLRATGLLAARETEPRFTVIDTAQVPQQPTTFVSEAGSQSTRQVITPDLKGLEKKTPSLNRLFGTLGLTTFVSVTIQRDGANEPTELEISGLGADAWSLAVLRTGNFAAFDAVGDIGEQPTWRSYSLDLRRQANRAAFDRSFSPGSVSVPGMGSGHDLRTGSFDTQSAAGTRSENPYEALRGRFRDDSVLVESELLSSRAGASSDHAPLVAALRQAELFKPGSHSLSIGRVRSADLSAAGAQLEPLFSCVNAPKRSDAGG